MLLSERRTQRGFGFERMAFSRDRQLIGLQAKRAKSSSILRSYDGKSCAAGTSVSDTATVCPIRCNGRDYCADAGSGSQIELGLLRVAAQMLLAGDVLYRIRTQATPVMHEFCVLEPLRKREYADTRKRNCT